MTDTHDILGRYHQAMLDGSADDLADLYADDAVHEFPFLFPGMPPRFEGREAVREGYAAAWGASPARVDEIRDVVVHETADPEVIVVEQEVVATIATTGERFAAKGVLVIRVQAGRIVAVRDYLDALTLHRSLGRLPQLVELLGR